MENRQELLSVLREVLQEKKDLVQEMKNYQLSENLPILQISNVEYNEYLDGVMIKDITTIEQTKIGVTILHALVNKDAEFSLHLHKNQSQTISVILGKIVDLENNLTFHPGESFFVRKNKTHTLKYIAGSELVIIYMPALKEIITK